MAFNYSKLAGKIKEVFKTQARFAAAMGMSERSLSLKMNNEIAWKQPEMIKSAHVLGFPIDEIHLYFFDA